MDRLSLDDANASSVGSARLGAVLTVLLGIPVLAFFCFAAFSPATLAVPVVPGEPMTIWFVYGLGLIAWAILLGGVYVLAANRAADRKSGAWQAGGLGALILFSSLPAHAAGPEPTGTNPVAVILFLAIVALTLAITYWAARRTKSAQDFYAAGGHLSGLQNGLAIAGDVISAGAFLGLAGLVYGSGFDGCSSPPAIPWATRSSPC